MKTYKVPCTWEMFGVLEIEAASIEEAKRIAIEDSPLPDDEEYVDGSLTVDDDMLKYYNEKEN